MLSRRRPQFVRPPDPAPTLAANVRAGRSLHACGLRRPRLPEQQGALPWLRDSGSIAQRMRLRAIITLAFARRIWFVAALLLA